VANLSPQLKMHLAFGCGIVKMSTESGEDHRHVHTEPVQLILPKLGEHGMDAAEGREVNRNLERYDLSEWLIHFTRPINVTSDDAPTQLPTEPRFRA